ncbi:hypothetical protein EJ08DRAFT_54366 [Tothia fuscella]|uniref:Uncharacterized protein n=1 Tax=Tothia fuscella TaxID=1048955 RepID=A0A9P4NFE4_9PEZI|nr:hypothetical protein EJ08DRAFT_54366 [Tothia fuscella]
MDFQSFIPGLNRSSPGPTGAGAAIGGPSYPNFDSNNNISTLSPQDDQPYSIEHLLAEARPYAPILTAQLQANEVNGHVASPQQYSSIPPQMAQTAQEIKQEIKPEVKQENMQIQPNGSEVEIDVPRVLLYGEQGGEEDKHVISRSSLAKLPKNVLANLVKDGEREGTILRLGSIPHWESVLRLADYLDHGDYRPFAPQTPLEYLDATGTALPWTHRESPKAVEVPRATYDLFCREIDFYLFLSKIGFAALRKISAERLCTRYPKSAQSIWTLVDRVHQVASKEEDTGLLQRLVEYININNKEVINLPEFVPLLRKLTRGRPPLGPVLFEAFITVSQAARRDLLKLQASLAGPDVPAEPLSIMQRITAPSTVKPSQEQLPPRRQEHPERPDFSSPFSAYNISPLIEILRHQNLVIANDNGYGTLVREGSRSGRNREFEFVRGELLVADREGSTVNGRHNIKVMNSRGEVGDILRTLVKKVPASLGVLNPDSAVNDGNRSPPDREQRNFNPNPFPGYRGRSRSPPPRRRYHP